jgi:hypothetical protein
LHQSTKSTSRHTIVCQLCATVDSLWIRESRLSTLARDRSISISDDQINRAYAIDILMMNTKQNVLQRSTDGCDAHPSVMTLSHTTIYVYWDVDWSRESAIVGVSIDCTSNQRLSRIAPQCDAYDHMRRRGWSESLYQSNRFERRAISQFVESREPSVCLSLYPGR